MARQSCGDDFAGFVRWEDKVKQEEPKIPYHDRQVDEQFCALLSKAHGQLWLFNGRDEVLKRGQKLKRHWRKSCIKKAQVWWLKAAVATHQCTYMTPPLLASLVVLIDTRSARNGLSVHVGDRRQPINLLRMYTRYYPLTKWLKQLQYYCRSGSVA